MHTDVIRERVEAAVLEEERTGQTAELLDRLLKELRAAHGPEDITRILDFINRYLREAATLLESVSSAAKSEQVLRRLRPVLDAATAYWDETPGLVPENLGLFSLTDDAYLSCSLLQRVSTTYQGQARVPLLSTDLNQPNATMRKLLGAELESSLNIVVEGTMQRRPIQRAIRSLRDWRGTFDLQAFGQPSTLEATERAVIGEAISIAEPVAAGEEPPSRGGTAAPRESLAIRAVKGGRAYRVWYATNRSLNDPEDPSRGFGNELDPKRQVHYGTCSVFVPKSHDPGSLGTKRLKRLLRGHLSWDDPLKLSSIHPADDQRTFFSDLAEQVGPSLNPERRQVLVYIHGYSTDFEGAALRAAQMGVDLQFSGETAFFSWPSSGGTTAYAPDVAGLEASEHEIANFLIRVVENSEAEVVHVIAHSLGNRGLARVVATLKDQGVHFGNIILAAPDVQPDLFRQLAVSYPEISNRTTLYVSPRDLALKASGLVHDGPRVGLTPPVTVLPGIDTVEVKLCNLLDLGHGYYAQAQEVINDIYQLLRYSAAPPRIRLETHAADDGIYWVLS